MVCGARAMILSTLLFAGLAAFSAHAVEATGYADASAPLPTASPAAQQSVEALLTRQDVQAALQLTELIDAASIETLITLTEIPAPPFEEEERGKAFAELLKQGGITDIVTDEVGNIIATRPRRGRRANRCAGGAS